MSSGSAAAEARQAAAARHAAARYAAAVAATAATATRQSVVAARQAARQPAVRQEEEAPLDPNLQLQLEFDKSFMNNLKNLFEKTITKFTFEDPSEEYTIATELDTQIQTHIDQQYNFEAFLKTLLDKPDNKFTIFLMILCIGLNCPEANNLEDYAKNIELLKSF